MNCAVHADTPAVAYCRTCGKALCENCKRDVMGAIYCEPCIAARLQGGQQAAPRMVPPPPPGPSAPSPGLALLLGFIPGVGAMYNGQFTKALIHAVVFALFIVGVSTTNQTTFQVIFGLLIGFAPVYMAFDAYKTAEAKRMGLPLPDPLGLERIFGVQEATASRAPASSAAAAPASPSNTTASETPVRSQDSLPTGAIVLIVLGVLLLLGNFTRFDFDRFWPLILIGVGLWIGYRRMSLVPRGTPLEDHSAYVGNRTCHCARCRSRGLMGAAILITLGVLFMIHEWTYFRFGEIMPVLLIVIGLMMYLGRSASTEGHVQPYRAAAPATPPTVTPTTPPAAGDQPGSEVNR